MSCLDVVEEDLKCSVSSSPVYSPAVSMGEAKLTNLLSDPPVCSPAVSIGETELTNFPLSGPPVCSPAVSIGEAELTNFPISGPPVCSTSVGETRLNFSNFSVHDSSTHSPTMGQADIDFADQVMTSRSSIGVCNAASTIRQISSSRKTICSDYEYLSDACIPYKKDKASRKAVVKFVEDSSSSDSSDSESTDSEKGEGKKKGREPPFPVFVLSTNQQAKYDKRDSCPYCKRLITSTNFLKHLMRRHETEEDVVNLQKLPVLTLARKRAVQLIRNQGNFIHNKKTLETGGNIIVCQRPEKTMDITDNVDVFAACSLCYGFYMKRDLSRHHCPAISRTERSLSSKLNPSLLTASEEISMETLELFNRMHNDKLSKLVMSDKTIISFLNQQLDEKGLSSFHVLTNKVRLVAELLTKLREMTSNNDLTVKQALQPQNITQVGSAFKTIFNYKCGDLRKGITMDRPSSAIRLSQTLFQMTKVLHMESLKAEKWKEAKVMNSLPVLLEHYITPLSRNASKLMRSSVSGVPQDLPTIESVTKLTDYLDGVIFHTPKTSNNRKDIAEAVLARLIIFNKRRSSEVAKIRLIDWERRHEWKESAFKDMENLDETEKVMVKESEITYVLGKCRKHVPVIFPSKLVSTVIWLAEQSHNEYLFPNKFSGHIRGHDAVRKTAKEAGLDDGIMSSTKFRKLAATTLQLENFSETEFRILCDHLGHTVPVHKRYYRLRDTTTELTKVAKMLLTADRAQCFKDQAKSNEISEAPLVPSVHQESVENKENVKMCKITKPWTKKQVEFLRLRCAKYILSGTAMKKRDAEKIIEEMPLLFRHRSWNEIKDKVNYEADQNRAV